jgi:hypothetical protein
MSLEADRGSQDSRDPQGSSQGQQDKGHELPTVAPRGAGGDVLAGHQSPTLERGHQPPEGSQIELGHPPAEGMLIVQSVGETHSPPTEAPAPTVAPPKPVDSAESVTPPPSAPPSGGDPSND